MQKKICLVICLIMALMLSACEAPLVDSDNNNNNITPPVSEIKTKTISLIGYNFKNKNPLIQSSNVNRQIFSLVYDSLYVPDQEQRPTNLLSRSEIMNNNGMSWEIGIKENVLFHDGTNLSASDVVATVNFLLKTPTYYSYNVRNIANVKVKGNNSVVFNLTEPAQNFVAQLTFPIVSAKSLLDNEGFIGTGKFEVKTYIENKKIGLEYFKDYHISYTPQIEKIDVQLVPDNVTAKYSYKSGLADVFSQDIFSNDTTSVTKNGTISIDYTTTEYSFLLLNNNMEIFKNKQVRKALNMAISREKIITDVLFSHGISAVTPIHPDSYLRSKSVNVSYDIEKSKEMLKELGFVPNIQTGILEFKMGETVYPLSFKITVNEDNNFRIQVANVICENMKYIGVECKVDIVPFEKYEKLYREKSYEGFIGSMQMGYDYDLTSFIKTNENISNFSGEIGDLILNNISTSDHNSENKQNYYYRLQEFFVDEVPHISLYYTKNSMLYTDRIKEGLKPNSFSIYNNIENWTFK